MDDETIRYDSPWSGRAPKLTDLAIEAPDVTQEDALISRGIATADLWRGRVTRRLKPQRPLPAWVVPVAIALVLAIMLPSVLVVASAFEDYASLRSLGES